MDIKESQVLQIARTTWYPTFGPKGPRRMSSRSSKSGCGTMILLIAILAIFGFVSSHEKNNNPHEPVITEQVTIDSLAVALHIVDK